MSPQLTLQTPLELPPSEVPHYLDQLWSRDQASSIGAHTFCLLIWQPAWVEQQLVRTGRLEGPIMGVQRNEVEEAGRKAVLELDLPLSPRLLEAPYRTAWPRLMAAKPAMTFVVNTWMGP